MDKQRVEHSGEGMMDRRSFLKTGICLAVVSSMPIKTVYSGLEDAAVTQWFAFDLGSYGVGTYALPPDARVLEFRMSRSHFGPPATATLHIGAEEHHIAIDEGENNSSSSLRSTGSKPNAILKDGDQIMLDVDSEHPTMVYLRVQWPMST